MRITLVTVVMLFLLSSEAAFAYIDPGTGATIIGNLWHLLVALLAGAFGVIIKVFWNPIKKIIFRKKA